MLVNSNHNRMKQEETAVEQKIRKEIKQIYEVLMRFGYPGLLSSTVLESQAQMEKYLGEYFQPTPKRENLIQWLILTINPLYSQQMHSKTNKKRIILNNLWKLGVMPFSKHTNNLDYQRYLQGLLGYENSVNLVYNLCTFLRDSFQYSKSKQDTKFLGFLDEIINNYDNLVNLDYDPYKISFPAAYQQMDDDEFEKQYQQVIANIVSSGQNTLQNQQALSQLSDYEFVFKHFQQNKQRFMELYAELITKVKGIIDKNQTLIENWKDMQTFQGRTLKISTTLPKIYRTYKQKIKVSKISQSKLAEDKVKLKNLIQSLNDTVCL